MEKRSQPQEPAPPYPGPPLNYGGPGPQQGFYSQPGLAPQQGYAPQPGYAPQSGNAPQPGTAPQPGNAPQPGITSQPGIAPQPGYAPQPGFAPATSQGVAYAPVPTAPVVTQVVVSQSHALRDLPGQTVCPHCHQNVVTFIRHSSGLLPWAISVGLFIIGCWVCCFIPFCIDSCKDVEHHCPTCNRIIYVHKRL
uniref:Annexin A11a n=3 Tax=Nothobranchius kuhntae TaxID=321403 RepID=A0A1A8JWP2_NOTKU